MRGYWPIGANGSILITSRESYNFLKEGTRKGLTVQPFNATESWELFLQLLDENWRKRVKDGELKKVDRKAARAWVRELGGLGM